LEKQRLCGSPEPANPLRDKTCEGSFYIVRGGGIEDDQPDAQQACRRLYGHAATPSPAMNSRRFICNPQISNLAVEN
jgi:hypothetical protein